MDGIDAALLELDDNGGLVAESGHTSIDYDDTTKILLKAAEYCIRNAKGDLALARAQFTQDLHDYLTNQLKLDHTKMLASLNSYMHGSDKPCTLDDVIRHSTTLHIRCVEQLLALTQHTADQITVIGYHGQTVYHKPADKITISMGDPQYMADQLKIKVVHDFRREDVAAGGQGAPFAPLYHYALARRDNAVPVCLINCGGISNVTLIPSADESEMMAFDTGPGNGLIDLFVRKRTQGAEFMDRDGKYGKRGGRNQPVLDALFQGALIKDGENYLLKSPPKSLDIADMRLIPEMDALDINGGCANLEAFTAMTIVDGLRLVSDRMALPSLYVLCGGGWKNPIIRAAFETDIRDYLGKDVVIKSADQAGWNSDAMEAQIFAYLAVRSLQGKPLSLPNTTGVPRLMTGGTCYRPS
jgi:anhydro-N-acetylmuramic acid kinase